MKITKLKIYLLTLAMVLLSIPVKSQDRGEKLNLPEFDEIHMGTSGEVYLKQGSETEVILEAPERRKDNLEIEVKGGKLYIGNKSGANWRNRNNGGDLVVYVTIKDIRALKVSSAGRVFGRGVLKADEMDLAVSGSGRIEVELEADELESSISGSGRIELGGKCNYNDVNISGSGRLLAEGLVSEVYYISISGSGNCRINVSKKMEARVSGSGRVYYKGNPDKVDSRVSGSGGIRKI